MEGAESRLRLFQMDLLQYDSIVAAVTGAAGVFHLASPCIVDKVHDPEGELLDPAIKGTINVLTAAKELGVRRVVVTSSISAIIPSPNWPADVVKNEDCWTDEEYCKRKGHNWCPCLLSTVVVVSFLYFTHPAYPWYPLSKTLAEKAAWEFAEGKGCTEVYEDFFMGSVHVKDVALAHLLVYENTSATGRHLCVEAVSHNWLPKDTQPGLRRSKDASKKLIDLVWNGALYGLWGSQIPTAEAPNPALKSSAMDALRLLLIFSLISASAAVDSGDKVSFEVYYESLCPYCSNLIVNYLYKLFDSDLISITDFKLVPYGNAKIRPNGTITCQHGPNECLLNTVEACAIDVWPDVKAYFPLSIVWKVLYTITTTPIGTHVLRNWVWMPLLWLIVIAVSVEERHFLHSTDTIQTNVQLELQYAAETNALDPPHRYVPWVVVDGQPLYDDYRDFVSYICKAYKGTDPPSACAESSVGGIWKVKMNTIQSLYGQETVKSKLFRTGQAIVSWLQRKKIVVCIYLEELAYVRCVAVE
ncbi:UNVERIFIED_CONTAM: Cinnamoyl-CoA reductase 1 [Sesamum calycinum]|uniref:Cinnamoyl-CoA reductase 1 n=1 Tax=Sesamum calycinum TaxID=2727403 RepID=A0AAW2SEJ3_9LAMI